MLRFPLPPRLVAVAREYADGVRLAAEPRDAATVALLRRGAGGVDGVGGVEVYLLRRHTDMAFAAGMSVFPGGGVDPRDFESDLGWAGPQPSDWAGRLGVEESLARALVCAAVRETFEECGVLLAGPDEGTVVADVTSPDWEADRRRLEGRELSLSELLTRRGLVVRTDLLGVWAGWLTPVFEPRRYRTWFFVAELPAGQVTRDVSTESDQVAWLSAAAAVASADAAERFLLPPTYLTCLEIARYADPPAVLAAAEDRVVDMFMPEVVDLAGPDGPVTTLSVPERFEPMIDEHLAGR